MGKGNIEKWSLGYELLRAVIKFWHNHVYYRHIYVLNADNIPEDDQVIFAPNHQNALMDAMAVQARIKKQPVFLARSDIFKKRPIARILYFLKILPIYRIRDGYSALKKNEEIFDKTIDILQNKSGLVVLPEGNHAGFRKLRNLKKGIARLAFQSAEKQNFAQDIKIVPAGIDYSHYSKFRQDLTVSYGEPVSLAKYYDLYKEHPSKAIVEAIRELSEVMKRQIIHIPDDEHYQIYDQLRQLFLEHYAPQLNLDLRYPANRIEAQQKFITLLDEYLHADEKNTEEIQEKLQEYNNSLSKLHIRNWVLDKTLMRFPGFLWRAVAFLLGLPVFVYGFINNILPYKIPIDLANKVEDKVFVSSFKFILSFLLFPLFYLLQTGIVFWITHHIGYALFYLISLPLTGIFAFQYFILFKKFRARWKYSVLRREKNPDVVRLQKLHQFFVKLTNRIISGKGKSRSKNSG